MAGVGGVVSFFLDRFQKSSGFKRVEHSVKGLAMFVCFVCLMYNRGNSFVGVILHLNYEYDISICNSGRTLLVPINSHLLFLHRDWIKKFYIY